MSKPLFTRPYTVYFSSTNRAADVVVQIIVTQLLLAPENDSVASKRLFGLLPTLEQKKMFSSILKFLSETYLGHADTKDRLEDAEVVSAVAGLIRNIVQNDAVLLNQLVSWLTTDSGVSLGEGLGIRRSVMAVVSQEKDHLSTVLEKAVDQFGDPLFIKHAPILQQEGLRAPSPA